MVTRSIDDIRSDFPALSLQAYGKPLAYLDNAATTHKPAMVIDALHEYYATLNANVHRGAHLLSLKASEAFEQARQQVRDFLNAPHENEIIFTRGATESINLVAFSFGRKFVGRGDEILISHLEHHSNIVPWQMLCQEKEAILKVIPVLDIGELDFETYCRLLSDRTRLVAITHVSNTLGTVVPVRKFIDEARKYQIPVLIDGAQAVAHQPVDVQSLGCDFYCFSGHKMYGPMGIGVLWGKQEWLEQMPPYQGGGEMIKDVSFERTVYNDLPYKFEAGTPNVAGAIGLARAIGYINEIGFQTIAHFEDSLLKHLTEGLMNAGDIRILGNPREKASVVSFNINRIHPYDAGVIIDRLGIAVRTGNHCTQPLMERFQVPGTIRASLAFYNTHQEIDRLLSAVEQVKKLFY